MRLLNMLRGKIGTEAIRQFLNKQQGFDKTLEKMSVIKAGDGSCLAELKIEEEHTNSKKILHGGLITTLIDSVTSCAFVTHKSVEGVKSVSVNINVQFYSKANIGDTILIEAKTVKTGKTMGYLECTLSNKDNRDIVAKGNHTKFLLVPK